MGAGRLSATAAPAVFGWVLAEGNVNTIWFLISGTLLAGALVTFVRGIETRGRSLEELGQTGKAVPSALKTDS